MTVQVNNAYEVLNDEQNRKVSRLLAHIIGRPSESSLQWQLYDRYGVWPPPTAEPEPQRRSSTRPFRSDPFSDPFFSDPFGSSRHPFTFTDPFVLFNSLFGDLHRAFFDEDPFFEDPLSARSPFDRMGMGDPFGHSIFGGSLFGPRPGLMIGGPGSMLRQMADASGSGDNSNSRMYSAVSQAVGRNGQWVSQSTMSRTINGRTEVITKRRDIEVSVTFHAFSRKYGPNMRRTGQRAHHLLLPRWRALHNQRGRAASPQHQRQRHRISAAATSPITESTASASHRRRAPSAGLQLYTSD